MNNDLKQERPIDVLDSPLQERMADCLNSSLETNNITESWRIFHTLQIVEFIRKYGCLLLLYLEIFINK